MPKERLQVDSGIRPVPLTPVASPVDTFRRTDAGAQLAQLAQGLSTLEPSLARFTAGYTERVNQEQQVAGETAARKFAEQGKTYAQAIKDGLIPRGSSPFFVAGFKEQFGRVTADRWQSDLTLAVAKDDKLRTTTNLEDFDSFVQQHRKDWMQANVDPSNRDQFFETGFGHRADAYLTDARRQFASQLAARVERFSEDAHFQEVKKHVLDNFGKFTDDQIAADITQLNDDVVAQGRDGTAVNQVTVRAIAAAALERAQMGDHRALQILDLLQKVKGGKPDARGERGILSNTEYGTNAGVKVRDDISNLLYQADQRERQKAKDFREDKERTVLSSAVTALMQNPYADLSTFVTQADGLPGAISQLTDLQRNIAEIRGVQTDQEVKRSLYSDIWTRPDQVNASTVINAMNHRKLSVPDANFLIEQLATRDREAKDKGNEVFNDFQFRQVIDGLPRRFANPLTGIVAADVADRASYAEAQLREAWVDYKNGAGATASKQEQNAFLVGSADEIVKQQLQGVDFSISKAPPPELKVIEQKLPKTAVLTKEDLSRIGEELRQGRVSPNTARVLQQYDLHTALEISQFIRSQMRLAGSAAKPQEQGQIKQP